jgi:hypothetical protein
MKKWTHGEEKYKKYGHFASSKLVCRHFQLNLNQLVRVCKCLIRDISREILLVEGGYWFMEFLYGSSSFCDPENSLIWTEEKLTVIIWSRIQVFSKKLSFWPARFERGLCFFYSCPTCLFFLICNHYKYHIYQQKCFTHSLNYDQLQNNLGFCLDEHFLAFILKMAIVYL